MTRTRVRLEDCLRRLDEANREPRPPWSWKIDGAVAGALALLVALTRLRDASKVFYTVDSVLFGLATEHYDLMALQPHPPGYPIFVAMGWVGRQITGEANSGFVLVAALFSILAVVATYGIVLEFASRRVAFAAAVLLSFTTSFYFNGVVALSYTAEGAASVALAWLAWRHWRTPTRRNAIALAVAASFAVGIRPSLSVFLGPLVALALLGRRARPDPRHVAWGVGSGVAATLVWFVPAALATGGLADWRRATRLQADHVVFADAVWQRGVTVLYEHWDRLLYYLGSERAVVLPGLLGLIGLAGLVLLARRERPHLLDTSAKREALLFFLAWLVPGVAFYLLVFDGWNKGPIGYVLTVLPGLYVIGALLADASVRTLESTVRGDRLRIVAGLGMSLLLLVPAPALYDGSDEYVDAEVRAHDEWAQGWESIRGAFPPSETAILTWHSWAHVKWYFPEYVGWVYFPSYKVTGEVDWIMYWQMQHHHDEARFIDKYLLGPGQPEHPVPGEIRRIVVFDFQLAGENGEVRRLAADVNVTEVRVGDWRLLAFAPQPERPTIESYFRPLPA